MIVDIGADITEIAVIVLSGIDYSGSIRMGGNRMDSAIIEHVKRRYNLEIGARTALSARWMRVQMSTLTSKKSCGLGIYQHSTECLLF